MEPYMYECKACGSIGPHERLDEHVDECSGVRERNCAVHQFRTEIKDVRSIGRVEIEICNNCLSVVVIQRRGTDSEDTRTIVEMKDSAYPYVK